MPAYPNSRRARLFFTTIVWLMSVLMVLTPTTVTLADAFHDAAHQGQEFGRAQIPDPVTMFKVDGNGGYVLSTGDGKTVHVTPQDVFGQGPGSVGDLKNLWGDNKAIHKETKAVQQQLQTDQSEYGEAYRVLKSSSQRAHPDLSNDPIWGTSRGVMTDIFKPGGIYSACEVAKHVTEDKLTTHLPEYRSCNRIPAAGDDCTVTHDYDARVIEHASGPLNIQSCGAGCRDIWLGHNREGIIPERGSSCFIYEYPSIGIRVLNPDAITDVKLSYVEVDDRLQLWLDGSKVWQGPDGNFPPETGGSCDLHPGGSFHLTPNADLTLYFKNATPGQVIHLKIRVSVGGHDGNGYARFKLHFDPSKKISGDVWHVEPDCQAKIDAVSSGFASGSFTCTESPTITGGCTTTGVTPICESDLKPSPVPGISPLCREATVHSALDFNKGQMQCWTDPQGEQHCPVNEGTNPDTCGELESDPNCRFLSSKCVDGAKDEKGNCYAYTVRYDCGQDVDIPTANETSTYTCPGGVGCMGSACIDTTVNSNHDFAHAVAALQAADYMSMDMTCPTGQENNIDPNTCTVFAGEASECKIAVGGQVDCCETQGAGVSLAQFITLVSKTRKIAGMVTGQGGVLHGAWTKITKPITDAWGSITSYFGTSLDANAAATPAHMVGTAELEQLAMKKTANFLVQTFGESTANLFFTTSGQASVGAVASGQAQGSLALGGAVGTALSVAMTAYTVYVMTMLLINVIWKCEKSEFELGAKRKLKSAHYVGSYCKTKTLGVCIEKRKSYCTFNSPLSRILQEQIRAQLGISWGSDKHPNCRALSVAEINEVDWDKINLDEWLAILQTTGHMPQSPADAMSKYSLDQLTEKTATLNFDGKREDTATRNQQRLDNDKTLHRNEALRQSLWNGEGGSGQATSNPPPPGNRPSPCQSGTKVYSYTGGWQYFTVPPRCRRLDVLVVGGDSGGATNMPSHPGQRVTDQLMVDPGMALPVMVGKGGGVDSYWDKGRNVPAYIGLAGKGGGLYKVDGTLWVGANGAAQVGPVSARASHYWYGKNGVVVIQWGPGALEPPAGPQPQPAPAPAKPEPPVPQCSPGSRVFNYTGGVQSFVMPKGCKHLLVTGNGAGGGGGTGTRGSFTGGVGARVTGTLTVTPGAKMSVLVGQGGREAVSRSGFGATLAAGGGGGRSAILTAGGRPLVVAGGGGGASHSSALGSVGAPGAAGLNGEDAGMSSWGVDTPARGGSQSRGGAGEVSAFYGTGGAGSRGRGGDVRRSGCASAGKVAYGGGGSAGACGSVGGGGGGYYGGGSGVIGAGGGGSSYIGNLQNPSVITGGGSAGGHGNHPGANGTVRVQWMK